MSTSTSKPVNTKKTTRATKAKKPQVIVEDKEDNEIKVNVIDQKDLGEVIVKDGETVIKEEPKKTEKPKKERKQKNEKVDKSNDEEKPKEKKKTPPIFSKRNEVVKYIVQQEEFKGFWSPVNKLLSWIINEYIAEDEKDKLIQLDKAKEYYDEHKKECHDKLEEFKKETKKTTKTSDIEPGRYLVIYKGENDYSYATLKHTGIRGNISKHKKINYEFVKQIKVDDTFNIKDDKFKDYIEIKHNRFTMKDDKDIEELFKQI